MADLSAALEQKKKRLEQESKQEGARQKTLSRELDWVRMNPKARQAKSKARIAAYETLLAQEKDKAYDPTEISYDDLAPYYERAEWEIGVQLCVDLKTMPIEDASIVWPEDQSPYVPVARLRVPRHAVEVDTISRSDL